MYKPTETDTPSAPTTQPQPAEPDFTRPGSDRATRLPLPGEIREPQPPHEPEVPQPSRTGPHEDSQDRRKNPVLELGAAP